jgi:hypothetical protein
MNPILRFLDWLIREHGSLLSGLFIYILMPLAAWFMGRRAGRKKLKGKHTFILVIHPPKPTATALPVQWDFESSADDESSPFDGL